MHGNQSYNSPRNIVLAFANYFQSVYEEDNITESNVLVASKRLKTGLTA